MANTFDPSGGGGGGGSFDDDDSGGSSGGGTDFISIPTPDLGGNPAQDDDTSFEDAVDHDAPDPDPVDTGGSSGGSSGSSGSSSSPTDGVSGNVGNRDGTTEDNRLAAYLSSMAGGDGGGQTGFGTTADEVLDTVATSPDRFQEAVAGAREQYAQFREANPMSEVLEEYGGDALTDDDSGGDGEGTLAVIRSRASSMGTVALAVAGVAVVGVGAAVLGGGDEP